MKICFVNSNFYIDGILKGGYHLPVGLLMLAATLKQKGFTSEIIDLPYLVKQHKLTMNQRFAAEAAELIIRKNIKVIGFNTRCDTYPLVLATAKKCKELRRDIIIILGGPQATFCDIETLEKFPFVDVIVRGVGELTIVDLMERIKKGSGFNNILGITFKEKNGRVIKNSERNICRNLLRIPQPSYYLLDKNIRKNKIVDWPIIYGRGCPGKCIFCSTSLMNRRHFMVRRIQDILAEIEFIKKKYNISHFHFIHDQFVGNKEKVSELCELLLSRKLMITWGCSARINCLDPDLIALMSKAGCKGIFFGIESGSPRIQRLIQKHLDVSRVIGVIEACDKHNIQTIVSFILGFPEEREEDVNMTLNLALRCRILSNCNIQLHLLSPMSGTVLLKKYEERLVFTKIFSDLCAVNWINSKECISLIRQYPKIFTSFYTIKPKYIPLTLPYKITNIFVNILRISPVTCSIVLKDLQWSPIKITCEFEKWLRNKKKKKFFQLSTVEMRNLFQSFFEYSYKKDSLKLELLRRVSFIEKKHFSIKKKPKIYEQNR